MLPISLSSHTTSLHLVTIILWSFNNRWPLWTWLTPIGLWFYCALLLAVSLLTQRLQSTCSWFLSFSNCKVLSLRPSNAVSTSSTYSWYLLRYASTIWDFISLLSISPFIITNVYVFIGSSSNPDSWGCRRWHMTIIWSSSCLSCIPSNFLALFIFLFAHPMLLSKAACLPFLKIIGLFSFRGRALGAPWWCIGVHVSRGMPLTPSKYPERLNWGHTKTGCKVLSLKCL